MLHPSKPKSTAKNSAQGAPEPRITRSQCGPTLFPEPTKEAKALGLNRATLYRVLTGKWNGLKTLCRRCAALKANQAA